MSFVVLSQKGQFLLETLLKRIEWAFIDLGKHDDERFLLKEHLDGLKESNLLVDREPTLLTDVNEVHNTGVQVSQGSDSLHFNSVSLSNRSVEKSRGIDNLPVSVLELSVSHKETLGREGVVLNIHICVCDLIHKARLSNIRVSSDDHGSRLGVYLGQSLHVLSDLLEVLERRLEFLKESRHSTKSCSFEHLASVQRVSILQHSHVVVCYVVHDGLGLVEVT